MVAEHYKYTKTAIYSFNFYKICVAKQVNGLNVHVST